MAEEVSKIAKEAEIELQPSIFGFGLFAASRVILELREDGTVTWRDVEPRTTDQPPVV